MLGKQFASLNFSKASTAEEINPIYQAGLFNLFKMKSVF